MLSAPVAQTCATAGKHQVVGQQRGVRVAGGSELGRKTIGSFIIVSHAVCR